jgi:hypothetical protein
MKYISFALEDKRFFSPLNKRGVGEADGEIYKTVSSIKSPSRLMSTAPLLRGRIFTGISQLEI